MNTRMDLASNGLGYLGQLWPFSKALVQERSPGKHSSPGHLTYTSEPTVVPETIVIGFRSTGEAESLKTAFPEIPEPVRSKTSGKHPHSTSARLAWALPDSPLSPH